MGAVQKAIVDAGGYTWSLVPGQENANASPILMTNSPCSALSPDRYYPPPPRSSLDFKKAKGKEEETSCCGS
jgi:hypothetical protein